MVAQLSEAVNSYTESQIKTCGDFATEDEAKAAFLAAIKATECFNVYSEVDCWYFGGSVFGDRPTGRIDFILSPKKPLIDRGWTMGMIGVECKKSGHKAGPLICQMIDYSKAVFRLPDNNGGCLVCLTAICCFPGLTASGGAIGSIMANHRIGSVTIHQRSTRININTTAVFSFDPCSHEFTHKNIHCGYKNGSR
jgi:hypothetical protein